ncbi:tyrosine-type recombinase/integrase [Streptomyces sp. NPDC006691]|uniref:tyrosine-type recombinase/integrase n=1 Tax=Streptomyces sp. NPDC006691 TaxID=3364757 RepID=UPI003690AEC3
MWTRTRSVQLRASSSAAGRALIDAASARYRALFLLAASSGLRQGELFGLEVDGVDFLRREVTVRQQLIDPEEGEPYLGEPKTHESYRTVPLTKAAVDALAAHLERFPAPAVKIEDRTAPRRPRQRTARLIFPNQYSVPVRRGSWSHVWKRTRQRANKALTATYEQARAAWVRRGKPDGSAKPSITLDTYTHLWPDEEDTTRAAVEAVLGDVRPLCPARSA